MPRATSPALVSWNITLRCPLKCGHCYADAGEREAEGVLSTQEAFSVIDQIAFVGRPVVVLSGGEPRPLPVQRNTAGPLGEVRAVRLPGTSAAVAAGCRPTRPAKTTLQNLFTCRVRGVTAYYDVLRPSRCVRVCPSADKTASSVFG